MAVLLGASAFLLLWRLDVPLLWQDEAETANVAESILLRGYPSPWDGEHVVAQLGGREAVWIGGRLLWAWHPWPQHYLAAAGLGLLGHSTAAARLPFALVALLSVPLFLAWRLRRDRFATAAVATAIYALAPAFVLYSRQSRYYALLFLGGVLALWAYEALMGCGGTRLPGSRRRRLGAAAGLALSLALLFYANPLSGLAFAAGVALHGVLRWRRREAALAPLLGALALLALLAAPWLVLVAVSDVRTPALGWGARLGLLVSQLWRLQYTLLPAVLWPALAWLWWRARRRRPAQPEASHTGRLTVSGEIELLALLAAVNWLAVAVLGPMGTARYALALWPLAAATLAALWRTLEERSTAAASAFLGLLLLTNAFQALPALPLTAARWGDPVTRWYDREAPALDKLAYHGRVLAPLPLHLARLARRECGPVAAVVAVARGLERPPRLVVASYGWESLHFYLGAPAAGSGDPAARVRLGLPPLDLSEADLVVPRRGWPLPDLGPGADPAFVLLDTGVPDYAYENLPDPTGYRFTDAPLGALPTLRLWVRRELLPAEGFGTLQAPGCRPLSHPPGGAGGLADSAARVQPPSGTRRQTVK